MMWYNLQDCEIIWAGPLPGQLFGNERPTKTRRKTHVQYHWYSGSRTAEKWRSRLRPGDTVQVHVKVVEGTRERIQVFEGVVIKIKGGGIRETFTVRRVAYGVGVERTFPLHSPRIDKIVVKRHGKVRRAKLYYLRNLTGKAARIKEVRR